MDRLVAPLAERVVTQAGRMNADRFPVGLRRYRDFDPAPAQGISNALSRLPNPGPGGTAAAQRHQLAVRRYVPARNFKERDLPDERQGNRAAAIQFRACRPVNARAIGELGGNEQVTTDRID